MAEKIITCPNSQCNIKLKIYTEKLNPEDPKIQCPKCKNIFWYRNVQADQPEDLTNPGWLVVHDENAEIQTHALKIGKNLIGRFVDYYEDKKIPDIKIKCRDNTMSRNHCIIEVQPDPGSVNNYFLCDFNSLNGTFLNCKQLGQFRRLAKVDKIILKDGDVIQMGRTKLILKTPKSANSSAEATTLVLQTPYAKTVILGL